MRKKVFLHIGYLKTGSTSIQGFFNRNYDSLLNKGVLYPLAGRFNPQAGRSSYKSISHSAIPLLMALRSGITCPPWFKRSFFMNTDPEELLGNLISEIDVFPGSKVVISSEEFVRLGVLKGESCLRILRNYFEKYDTKIVCYIRRQDDYVESLYNEIVKCCGKPGNIAVTGGKPWMGRFHHYHDCLSKWSQFFGKENVLVKVFSKKALPHGPTVDFLETIQVENDCLNDSVTINLNTRIDNKYIEIMRRCNQLAQNRKESVAIREFFQDLSSQEQGARDKKGYRLLNLEQRKRILDHYKECNKKLGTIFLNTQDEIFEGIDENSHMDISYDNIEDETSKYWDLILSSKFYKPERLTFFRIFLKRYLRLLRFIR